MVDVSIRVSLLSMLSRLKKELNVTFLFITHDLALAKYFAWEGRIAVMYLGRMVEIDRTPQLVSMRYCVLNPDALPLSGAWLAWRWWKKRQAGAAAHSDRR